MSANPDQETFDAIVEKHGANRRGRSGVRFARSRFSGLYQF